VRVVCISDTHSMHRKLTVPDGDLLLHAGDITSRGELSTLRDFDAWLSELPHADKAVIAGNHDFCFENHLETEVRACLSHATYLEDASCEVRNFEIYGTPWQPWFYDWAFNVASEDERREIWSRIPGDTDILLVHGPPHRCGDRTAGGEYPGCKALRARSEEIAPRLVVAGHIHEDYGHFRIGDTQVLNASSSTLGYRPVNPPIVIDI
jgi:Icc-related predicted phosphoesterase